MSTTSTSTDTSLIYDYNAARRAADAKNAEVAALRAAGDPATLEADRIDETILRIASLEERAQNEDDNGRYNRASTLRAQAQALLATVSR